MFRKILASVEEQNISISQWILALSGVLFIRFLLECLSNHLDNFNITNFIVAQDASTTLHFVLFFLVCLLGLILILDLLVGYKSAYKVILYGSIIIWFAPIFDIISTGGSGALMTYSFGGGKKMFLEYLSFFTPHITQGLTLGIRVEVLIILLGLGFLVWQLKRNIKIVIATVLISFTFIFILLSWPSFIYTVSHPTAFTATSAEVINFVQSSIADSNIKFNAVHANLSVRTYQAYYDLGFDKLLAQFFFLLTFIFLAIIFYRLDKQKFLAVIRNSRIERVFFYLFLLTVGMFYAYWRGFGHLSNWADILSLIVLTISWYSAWMYAVHTNDIVDQSIDKISSPDRPLITREISPVEMKQAGVVWLLVAIFGAFSVGYVPLFFILIFTAAYYIYSANPLRLKRIPVLSSFLISCACLATVMAGFFFLSENKTSVIFPVGLAMGLIVIFTLAVNVRDIKDIEGDKLAGINTLPVIFEKRGRQIVGIMLGLSFLLVPIVLSNPLLVIIALPTSIGAFWLAVRKPYKEIYIFLLYFIFMVLLVLFKSL